jgi:hypothetical protein
MVNIADGNRITQRGIGEKTIYDYKSRYPLLIKKMMIDDGYQVYFQKNHAIIKDKSG